MSLKIIFLFIFFLGKLYFFLHYFTDNHFSLSIISLKIIFLPILFLRKYYFSPNYFGENHFICFLRKCSYLLMSCLCIRIFKIVVYISTCFILISPSFRDDGHIFYVLIVIANSPFF